MFRADLSKLMISVVVPTASSGEDQGAAAPRYSHCFEVKPLSGTWESSTQMRPDQILLMAAVDAASHLKWQRALNVKSEPDEEQLSQTAKDLSTDELVQQAEALDRQANALVDESNDIVCQDQDESTPSASQLASDTKASQPASETEPAAGEATSGSPLPEMLKLVLRQSEKKQSGSAPGGIESDVAAVLVHRCPQLLRSVGKIRQEMYQQSTPPSQSFSVGAHNFIQHSRACTLCFKL